MFGRKEETHSTTTSTHLRDVPKARGGVSFGPILTGVVVAFGAMFLLSALVGGVLAGLGYMENGEISTGEAIDAGIGAGIALVVAQFLSYLWGGYTAGRMSRGAGAANGFLVPLLAIIVAIAVGGVATALGAEANLNLPFSTSRLPLENDALVDWGVGISIASLVAMFLGGILGGLMGARWHTKLERRELESTEERHVTHDRDVVGTGTAGTVAGTHTHGLGSESSRTETFNRPVVTGHDDHSPDLPTTPADSATTGRTTDGTTTQTYRS